MVVVFYGTGIPLFCSLKVIYPAFYARKKMWIPLKISLVAFVVNLVCNLILMRFLQQSGLALATVISSLINNSLLLWHLHREGFDLQVPSVASALCRIILVAVIASGSLYFVYLKFLRAWGQQGYLNEFCVLATIGICFMLLYLGLAYICKLHECQAVVQQIRKRLKR
jgi:putative peptidoglycan lipid II flippase